MTGRKEEEKRATEAEEKALEKRLQPTQKRN